MAKTFVYRVQPAGFPLGEHRSLSERGDQDRGVHVFGSLAAMCAGVTAWSDRVDPRPEVLEIECDDSVLRDDADYRGFVLVGNAGRIVRRKAFRSVESLQRWVKKRESSD